MTGTGYPNLFVIGAPKCGTTAIYHALDALPDVTMTRVKETGFFANDALYPLGMDHYLRSYLPGTPSTRYRGEASPWYLYQPEVIARLRTTLQEPLTLITMVRNPTDRAISMYFDQRAAGYETREPTEALDPARTEAGRFETRYVEHGHYARYLEPWREAFGDDLHVIPAPSTASPEIIRQAFATSLGLEVPSDFLDHQDENQRNVAGANRNAPLLKGISYLARSQRLKLAVRRALPPGFDQRVMAALRSRGRVSGEPLKVSIPPDLVRALDAHYAEEVAEMRDRWSVDLSPQRSAD